MLRSEETLLSSMDAFSVCLEDMETWLMESESVVDQRVNLADAEQISNLLTAVKVRNHSEIDLVFSSIKVLPEYSSGYRSQRRRR